MVPSSMSDMVVLGCSVFVSSSVVSSTLYHPQSIQGTLCLFAAADVCVLQVHSLIGDYYTGLQSLYPFNQCNSCPAAMHAAFPDTPISFSD
jgi:hypothetical protein